MLSRSQQIAFNNKSLPAVHRHSSGRLIPLPRSNPLGVVVTAVVRNIIVVVARSSVVVVIETEASITGGSGYTYNTGVREQLTGVGERAPAVNSSPSTPAINPPKPPTTPPHAKPLFAVAPAIPAAIPLTSLPPTPTP